MGTHYTQNFHIPWLPTSSFRSHKTNNNGSRSPHSIITCSSTASTQYFKPSLTTQIRLPTISSSPNITGPIISPSIVPAQIQLPLHKPNREMIKGDEPVSSCTTTDILRLMDCLQIPMTIDLYVTLVKDCVEMGDPLQAIELYKHFLGSGLFPTLPFLNLILFMHVSCGCWENARELFDKMTLRNSCTWAMMVAGYFEKGDYMEVVELFAEMQLMYGSEDGNHDAREVVIPGLVVCVLKACVEMMDLEFGKQVHGWIIKVGWSNNVVLSSSLISFYGRFGCVESSDCVFDGTPNRNNVVWTAKINSCCNEERYDEAIHVFRKMGKQGVKKNSYTFSSVLKACGKIRDGGLCLQQVHANVVKLGLELDGYVHCALVDVYGKYGLVADARRVFDMAVDDREFACWNAMVFGYMQQGLYMEAIRTLYEMKGAGFQLQESLLNELRFACGSNLYAERTG